MAAVTHGVTRTDGGDASSYVTGSFIPTADDLLVAIIRAQASSTVEGTVTDSLGGAWQLDRQNGDLRVFVRTTLASGAAMTVTFDCTGDSALGCIILVARVSGMTRTGNAATRQNAIGTGAIATTPTATFETACLTGNPTLALLLNTSNPATVTEPTGWTERADVGHVNPNCGAEYASRDSGFTGTQIDWGSVSATNWSSIIVELDTSAPSISGITSSYKDWIKHYMAKQRMKNLQ